MKNSLVMCLIEGFIALLITIVSIILFVKIPDVLETADSLKGVVMGIITLMLAFFVWMKTIETFVEYLNEKD